MEQRKDLADFLKALNKVHGENAVVRVGDAITPFVEFNPTAVLSFDLALGGGLAKGRIIEFFGLESSGKTSLSLMAIAEAQKKGELCAFIDVEQAMDFEYAQLLGVDLDSLIFNQPENAEDALEILDKMIDSGLFSIVVLDSVAALVTKAELEGEMGKLSIGQLGKLMSQATRKITGKIKKTNTSVIFINQVRDKIGAYIPTTITTGGHALKFAASQRVEIAKGTQIKDGDVVIGGIMRIKTVKNKVFVPFKKAEVDLIFGHGIDKMKDTLAVAIERGIIEQKGSWFNYGDVKLGQGINGVKAIMEDNPEMMEEITEKLYKSIKKNVEI